MKKSLFAVALMAFGFIACNKDKKEIVSPTTPTITASASTPQMIVAASNNAFATLTLKTGDKTEGFKFLLNFTGTVSLTGVSNLRYVAKRAQDSVTTTAIVGLSSALFSTKELKSNSEYTVTFYGDFTNVSGYFIPVISTWYWDQDMSSAYGTKMDDVVFPTVMVTYYSTTPTFTWAEQSGVMQDSIPSVKYKFTIYNQGPDRVSFSQFALQVNLNDVGSDDNLALYNLQYFLNNADSSADVKFSNSSSTPITSIPEGNNKIYISYWRGARQLTIEKGKTVTIEFRFTPSGLVHDGNGLTLQLLSDTNPIAPGFLNLVTQSGYVVKVTSLQPAGSAGTVYNLTYSIDGPSASGIPGSSTKMFVNGAGIAALGMQSYHQ